LLSDPILGMDEDENGLGVGVSMGMRVGVGVGMCAGVGVDGSAHGYGCGHGYVAVDAHLQDLASKIWKIATPAVAAHVDCAPVAGLLGSTENGPHRGVFVLHEYGQRTVRGVCAFAVPANAAAAIRGVGTLCKEGHKEAVAAAGAVAISATDPAPSNANTLAGSEIRVVRSRDGTLISGAGRSMEATQLCSQGDAPGHGPGRFRLAPWPGPTILPEGVEMRVGCQIAHLCLKGGSDGQGKQRGDMAER